MKLKPFNKVRPVTVILFDRLSHFLGLEQSIPKNEDGNQTDQTSHQPKGNPSHLGRMARKIMGEENKKIVPKGMTCRHASLTPFGT